MFGIESTETKTQTQIVKTQITQIMDSLQTLRCNVCVDHDTCKLQYFAIFLMIYIAT